MRIVSESIFSSAEGVCLAQKVRFWVASQPMFASMAMLKAIKHLVVFRANLSIRF
jgi:hypothetical protein